MEAVVLKLLLVLVGSLGLFISVWAAIAIKFP